MLDTEGEENIYFNWLLRETVLEYYVQQFGVVKDTDGNVLMSEVSVLRRRKEYFEELMNEENEREGEQERGGTGVRWRKIIESASADN